MEQDNNITIRLLDGSQITLSPEQIELYPTIQDQTTDLVPGNIVDINYPQPQALHQLLTNPNEALPFNLFLDMIEAADYVRNDNILNNLLVQMATTFTKESFTDATTEIKENMIDLVYHLRDTVLYRFLQLIQTIKLDYEIAHDPSVLWSNPVFSDDLNASLINKPTGPSEIRNGLIFDKNIFVNLVDTYTGDDETSPDRFSIDNNMNVYSFNTIMYDTDYPFLLMEEIEDLPRSTLHVYYRINDYEGNILSEYYTIIKLSQGGERYAMISNLEEDEEDPYAHYSIMRTAHDPIVAHQKMLAQFELPRRQYKLRNANIYGTRFPSVSPKMKIAIWQLPNDVIDSRYRITAIDLPQKPTFFINNINYLGVPPAIFQNWLVGQGYVLFNSEEDKLLLVRKTVDGHQISLMTDRGDILMEHLFVDEVPIFLVKDMIITVRDQPGDTELNNIMPV